MERAAQELEWRVRQRFQLPPQRLRPGLRWSSARPVVLDDLRDGVARHLLERSRAARDPLHRLADVRFGDGERQAQEPLAPERAPRQDRKSTRLNSSHLVISYAVFCL